MTAEEVALILSAAAAAGGALFKWVIPAFRDGETKRCLADTALAAHSREEATLFRAMSDSLNEQSAALTEVASNLTEARKAQRDFYSDVGAGLRETSRGLAIVLDRTEGLQGHIQAVDHPQRTR